MSNLWERQADAARSRLAGRFWPAAWRIVAVGLLFLGLFELFVAFWNATRIDDGTLLLLILAVLCQMRAEHVEEAALRRDGWD